MCLFRYILLKVSFALEILLLFSAKQSRDPIDLMKTWKADRRKIIKECSWKEREIHYRLRSPWWKNATLRVEDVFSSEESESWKVFFLKILVGCFQFMAQLNSRGAEKPWSRRDGLILTMVLFRQIVYLVIGKSEKFLLWSSIQSIFLRKLFIHLSCPYSHSSISSS